MVTHWESSKRSLYVKTVWRDGQHHVLLNQQQTPKQPKKPTAKHPTVNTRPIKSAPLANHSNLNVSSVRILDNEETKKKRRCKTSTKNRAKTAQKFKFGREELPCKTILEIDIKEKYMYNKQENLNETCLNLTTFQEPPFNSLTERVLMWLDLATQNGDFPNYVTLSPPEGLNTPQPAFKKRQLFARQRCFSSYQANCQSEVDKLSFQVEGTSRALQVANNVKNQNKPFEDDEIVKATEDKIEENVVSSCLEENLVTENIVLPSEEKIKYGVKRQLHIFLPDLKKKFGMCDSELSSRLSTCSLQKNENAREI